MYELDRGDDATPGATLEKEMNELGVMAVGIVSVLKVLSWQGVLATSPQVRRGTGDWSGRTPPEPNLANKHQRLSKKKMTTLPYPGVVRNPRAFSRGAGKRMSWSLHSYDE